MSRHTHISPRRCLLTVLLLLLSVASVSFAGSAARAQDKPVKTAPTAKAGPEKLPDAVAQVDGMTSRVVDDVWEGTDIFWHRGDYRRCVALIRVCVAVDPSFIEAYSTGVWLLWSMGDTPAADALLQDGEKRSPDKGDIDAEFGWHLFNTKRYAPAAQYLGRAIKVDPNQPPTTYSNLGHSLENLHRYDDAVKVFQMQVEKFPHFVAAPGNLQKAMRLRDAAKNGGAVSPTTGAAPVAATP